MAARRVVHGGLNPVTFDRFAEKANRHIRIGAGLFDAFFDGEIDGLEIVAVADIDDMPPERAHGGEGALHAEGVLRDAAGEFGVVVRNDEDERVDAIFFGQAGDGRERLLGFTFHRSAIGNRANGDAIIPPDFVRDGEPLGLRQSGAERAVAEENAFRVQMRFAVAGELAPDAAKTFQVFEGHAVEAVIGAEGVDSIFGVTGVVDEIKGLVPGAAFDREHDAVNGGHDFGESGRAAPMAGRAAVDGVDIHQRDESAVGAGIAEDDIGAGGVFDRDGILGRPGGGGGEPRFDDQGREGRGIDGFNDRSIGGHNFSVFQWFECK